MQNNYLVIVCGYEGIDWVVGLFSREQAIETVLRLRSKCGLDNDWDKRREQYAERSEWHDEMNRAMEAADRETREYWFKQPDQICVHFVNSTGSHCVCADLGLEPTDQWLF